MASYQQYFEYHFATLPTTTVYRFAELELNYYIRSQIPFLNYTQQQRMYDTLVSVMEFDTTNNEIYEVFTNQYFRRPTRPELITYMLFHHQPYKKICKLINVSPNTITKYKYQSAPSYFPIYGRWTPENLKRWRAYRQTFNIWNEVLVHSLENETDPEHYETNPLYIPVRNTLTPEPPPKKKFLK